MFYYYNNFNTKLFLKIKFHQKEKTIIRLERIHYPVKIYTKSYEFKPFIDFFSGRIKSFNFKFRLEKFSEAVKNVLGCLCCIPYGQIVTYSDIAKKVNLHPRFIGNVCRINPFPIIIPCHRVISKNGSNFYQWGSERKIFLQNLEKKFI